MARLCARKSAAGRASAQVRADFVVPPVKCQLMLDVSWSAEFDVEAVGPDLADTPVARPGDGPYEVVLAPDLGV